MNSKPEGLSWQLLTDPAIYEARSSVQKSVMNLLGDCADLLRTELPQYPWLPSEALESAPKITRGENYQGKPWMVLDYPRVFEKQSVFAFRTMALFGDAVHCTFHISGRFLEHYSLLSEESTYLNNREILVCKESNPWVHHVDSGSFKPVMELISAPHEMHGFIKYGMVIPFSDWTSIPEKVSAFFREISLLLHR
jgi:hypothetical protein